MRSKLSIMNNAIGDDERVRILHRPKQQHLPLCCDAINSRSSSSAAGGRHADDATAAVRSVTSLPALFDCGPYYVTGDDDIMLLSARCADCLEAPDYVIEVSIGPRKTFQ